MYTIMVPYAAMQPLALTLAHVRGIDLLLATHSIHLILFHTMYDIVGHKTSIVIVAIVEDGHRLRHLGYVLRFA